MIDNKIDDYLEAVADTLQGLAWRGAMYQDLKEVAEAAYLAGYTFSQDTDEEA